MTRFYVFKFGSVANSLGEIAKGPCRFVTEVVCSDEKDAEELAMSICRDGSGYLVRDADRVDAQDSVAV